MSTRRPPIPANTTNATQVAVLVAEDFSTKLRQRNSVMGRPRLDPAVFMEELIERLCAGETLMSVCRSADMPSYEWVQKLQAKNPDLYGQIDRARALGVEALLDALMDIASGGELSTGDIMRDRLLVEVLTKTIRMRNPQKFGEKLIPEGGTVIVLAPPAQDDGLFF